MLKDFVDNSGSSLLKHYNQSHIQLIVRSFPNHEWLPWKFGSVPKGYWESSENVKKYMNWLSRQLNVNKIEDWYNVFYQVSKIINKYE